MKVSDNFENFKVTLSMNQIQNKIKSFSVKQGYQIVQFYYLSGVREHPLTVHELTLKNIVNLGSLKSENFLQQQIFKKLLTLFQRVTCRGHLEKACDYLRMSLSNNDSVEKLMDPCKFSVIQFIKSHQQIKERT